MTEQLIYLADPMCSWCWGFSPVIGAVRERFGARLPLRLIMGGLRPGASDPLSEGAKDTIREHWEHVHEASGQPFDFAFFAREGFVYDTEPASRAVVTVRRRDPDAALPFLGHLHRAFYADNRDVTDRDELGALAAEFGLERPAFERAFEAEAARAETERDFAIAREAGITGFPTLLAGRDDTGYAAVTVGFQPWEPIERVITAWLAQQDSAGAPPAA